MEERLRMEGRIMGYAIDKLGLTEVDVRSWRVDPTADRVFLRTWNRRRFLIDGVDLFSYRRR